MLWIKFEKNKNRFYSVIDIGIYEERLDQITVNDDGSIQSYLKIMDE